MSRYDVASNICQALGDGMEGGAADGSDGHNKRRRGGLDGGSRPIMTPHQPHIDHHADRDIEDVG